LVLLFWIYQKTLSIRISEILLTFREKSIKFFGNLFTEKKGTNGSKKILEFFQFIFTSIVVVLALLSIFWIVRVIIANSGTVFTSFDTIASWNNWAINWVKGELPNGTHHYPQLLTANWSLSYLMMANTTIQIFNKAIMPFFTLFILLMMFDLGITQRKAGYFLAIFFSQLLINKFLGEFFTEGLGDLPCAFLVFLAFYTLIKEINRNIQDRDLFNVGLGAIFVAGGAVTKQGGVFFLVVYLILIFFLFFRNQLQLDFQKQRNIFLFFCYL